MKLLYYLLPQLLLLGVFLFFMFKGDEESFKSSFLDHSFKVTTLNYGPVTQMPPIKENPLLPQDNSKTSVKGGDDEGNKVTFQTTERTADHCHQVNKRKMLLCEMGLQKNCRRYQISEELSSWWMICPIYTANNDQTSMLYQLHGNFRDYITSYGIRFQTIEVAFPGQEFQLTKPNNQPFDLQYHAEWIFAMRENLVNVGVRHLPGDWGFMSWIDQHIFWVDPYWFEKCIWEMSHSNIVHMLNGNDFWNLRNTTDYHLDGFGRLYHEFGDSFEQHDPRQCGLAWGMRREIFEELGGLLDICAGTKCDLYQNYAYVGRRYTYQTSNQEYAEMIGKWQDHAISVYKKKLGFVDSKVIHFMHCTGACKTSEYNLHIYALMRHNYNPSHDMVRDDEGRLMLVNNVPLARELWQLYGGVPRN